MPTVNLLPSSRLSMRAAARHLSCLPHRHQVRTVFNVDSAGTDAGFQSMGKATAVCEAMKQQTRRRFMRVCLAAGLGVPVMQAGGKQKEDTAPSQSGVPRRRNKTSPVLPGTATIDPTTFEPAYLQLHRNGELRRRGQELWQRMRPCRLCQRTCGVDRLDGKAGFCQATSQLYISSCQPHFGEEPPLVGRGGSGTIFFTHCGLRCVFCINHEISLEGEGSPRRIEDLAQMMLRLQRWGCHNINVVTPTHYAAHIVLALDKAAAQGLRLPLVYNTCGWERLDILEQLDGIVDIYLPDIKYASGDMAVKYSTCVPPDARFAHSEVGKRYTPTKAYPELTQMALLEMHRQVGDLEVDSEGIASRGLLVRHLVMPGHLAGTGDIMKFISREVSANTFVNIMPQYRPCGETDASSSLSRSLTAEEFESALEIAAASGLTRLDNRKRKFMVW